MENGVAARFLFIKFKKLFVAFCRKRINKNDVNLTRRRQLKMSNLKSAKPSIFFLKLSRYQG